MLFTCKKGVSEGCIKETDDLSKMRSKTVCHACQTHINRKWLQDHPEAVQRYKERYHHYYETRKERYRKVVC